MDRLQKKKDIVAAEGCCGGPAPNEVDSCCVADAEAKDSGKEGCGSDTPTPEGVGF